MFPRLALGQFVACEFCLRRASERPAKFSRCSKVGRIRLSNEDRGARNKGDSTVFISCEIEDGAQQGETGLAMN